MEDKSCDSCGEQYIPTRVNQRYCSDCKDKGEWYTTRFNLGRRLGSLVRSAKNRAAAKDLPYDLDAEYAQELWDKQEGKCVVSGREFNLDSYDGYRQVHPDAPSIDRMEPSLGYVRDNVRLVTYQSNVCLNEYGQEQLLDLSEDILINAGHHVKRSDEEGH